MKLDEKNISSHLKDIYNFEIKTTDLPLIRHCMTQAETIIKNFCHVSTIPEGAVHPAIDFICAKFLKHKIDTGTLVDENGEPLYSFSVPETSVKMGDVSVSYESGYGRFLDNNGLFNEIERLADEMNFKREIVHFRRIKWPRS